MTSTLPGSREIETIPFTHSYAELPGAFHAEVEPTPVREPRLVALNRELAEELGLDPEALESPEGILMLAGNAVPATARPVALAYAGHQFGGWVPQLGDGRAILLGELTHRDGRLRDLQLKGSGPTPFSRRGDGRSSIGPVVREYLGSEAMAALGIPTTRALSAVVTGDRVLRQNGLEPGGVFVRVASSHVRVGTFEYFARQGDADSVRRLADYVIARHYPDLADRPDPCLALLEAVVERTADLVASWLLVGFIHGVMNTDNTSVTGETLDYGPFGFLDPYRPGEVYSSIDRHGRYAYDQQPGIAQWNLARLAETLLLVYESPEEAVERARPVIGGFVERFEATYHAGLVRKVGLVGDDEGDLQLAGELLQRMARENADFTRTFRELSHLDGEDASGDDAVRGLFDTPAAFDSWAEDWRLRLASDSRPDEVRQAEMRSVNPAFILRNHLAQEAVDAAIESEDFGPMRRLLEVLSRPFEDQPGHEDLARPPESEERVTRTFCGT